MCAALALIVACSGDTPASPIAVETDAPRAARTDAAAELAAAAQGRISRGFEDEILRLENRVAGLGGVFQDSAGMAVIWLRDANDAERRADAVRELRAASMSLKAPRDFVLRLQRDDSLRVLTGDYAFSELVAWQRAISRSVRVPGLLGIDADEGRNRVRAVIAPDASSGEFEQAISAAGVPLHAVVFERRESGRLLQSELRHRWRPSFGGLQIMNKKPNSECTIGFGVDMLFYNQRGFLTASHCAAGTVGSGSLVDPLIGQPMYKLWNPMNIIGAVHLNPPWNRTDPDCNSIALCTVADVMYVESAGGATSKHVAWTTFTGWNGSIGSRNVSAASTGLQVAPFIFQGATVYKVGRNTGQTAGTVGATCEHVYLTSPIVAVLCSVRVDNSASGYGDSGSPVYYPASAGEPAYAMGILFAGDSLNAGSGGEARCQGSHCRFWFSDWNQLQAHMSRYFSP